MPTSYVALIEAVGQACFGPHWRAPMAEALGTTVRSINRWRSGQVELTQDLIESYKYCDKLDRLINSHGRVRRRALERQLQDHDKRIASARVAIEKLRQDQERKGLR